jgi:hypothetical protein
MTIRYLVRVNKPSQKPHPNPSPKEKELEDFSEQWSKIVISIFNFDFKTK